MGKDWRFVCPACKGVQTPKEFDDGGQDSQRAYRQCIKRDPTLELIRKEKRAKSKSECDWAAWGLFQGPWIISAYDEEKGEDYEVSAFGFEGTTQVLIDRAVSETEAIFKEKEKKEDADGKEEKTGT